MATLKFAEVVLQDTPSYHCYAECQEQVLEFTITWIERLKQRAISVKGSDGSVFLQNTVINIGEPLEFNVNAKKIDYDYSLVLLHIPEMSKDVDYLNWSRNMFLTVYQIQGD